MPRLRDRIRNWLGIKEIEQVIALEVRSRRKLRDKVQPMLDAYNQPVVLTVPTEKVVKGYGQQPTDRTDAGAEPDVSDAI